MVRCQELLDAEVEEVVGTRLVHVEPWNRVCKTKIVEEFWRNFIYEIQFLTA